MASFEAARKKDQRRRSLLLLGICVLLAAPCSPTRSTCSAKDSQARSATIADIGWRLRAPAATRSRRTRRPVTRSTWPRAPRSPTTRRRRTRASTTRARHRSRSASTRLPTAPRSRPWCTTSSTATRSSGIATDAPRTRSTAQKISKTFTAENYDPADKFIAAPWTEPDGAGFPEGKNVVLTRWYADPSNPSEQSLQKGVRQPCAAVSGQAIQEFMTKYPSTSAPEPNGA